jgi:Signal transduction histidine kinase
MSPLRLGSLRDPERPILLSIVFWVVFVATAVAHAVNARVYMAGAAQSVVFGVNLALVGALWLTVPWNMSATARRKATAPALLAAAIVLGLTGSAEVHLPLILLAIARIAFVYGMRTATLILLAVFGGAAMIIPLRPDRTWLDALAQSAPMAVFATFVLGMASATIEARRRRQEAQELLERVRELAVAEERARMARDMHDSIGHQLTVIKMGLENAERFRERHPEMAWAEVAAAKKLTAEALVDARRWVRALRPLALDGAIGGAALEQLAMSFHGTGIDVRFSVHGEERRLDADTELVLYRVLQEGLTNALRHAKAETVTVTLEFHDDRVALVVADDGTGSGTPGFGLTSLTERAEALGGTLRAGPREGGGFELRADLPAVRA